MSDRSDKSESLLPGVTTRQSESDAKRLIRSDQRLLSGRDRNSFARFCSDYSLSEEAVIDFGIIVAAWSLAGLNSASVRTALTKLSSAPAKEARVHVIRSDQSCLEAIRRFVGGGELAISGATRLVIDSIDA